MTLKSTLRFVLLCIWLTGFFAGPTQAKVKVHSVSSPDGRLELQVVTQTGISFCLLHKGNVLVSSPALSMSLKDGTVLGPGARLISTKRTHVNDKIPSPLYRKSIIQTRYNQLDFRFREGFGIRFRIYDQGAAYQFYTTCKDSLYIVAETAGFIFPKDYTSSFPQLL